MSLVGLDVVTGSHFHLSGERFVSIAFFIDQMTSSLY
jgi:hypothetical protein